MRRALPLALVVVAAAGCGGSSPRLELVHPTLPRPLADSLRSQVAAVESALAAGDGCTARTRAVALQSSVVAAINGRRVPARFQEMLQSAVNELADRISCAPPPAPTPMPAPKPPHGRGKPPKPKPPHGPGRGPGNGKKHKP